MKKIDHMISTIESEVNYTRQMIGRDKLSTRVIDAMRKVPRDVFVSDDLKPYAFDNGPLPIGHNQTISQPFIVALMTDLLDPDKNDIVLEIGTGSGYQTAILSLLVKRVYTMEIVRELNGEASERLKKHHYQNIENKNANGYEGWPEHAPYDGIIVTAAAPFIPQSLVDQLKPGGHLVIPIGLPHCHQELMCIEKDEQGNTQTNSILGVAFVPMVDSQLGSEENNQRTGRKNTNI
jgi:protein-L-isoaspartate(D-aspartate) O-methyltransferase